MLISDSLGGRVHKALSVIRLRPFDTSTSEGRANERLRRVVWSAVTMALANGVSLLAIIVYIPLTLSYLGNERYGLWMVITSLVTFLAFSDLGIGNVVVNLVSEANGRGDRQAARKSVSNSFFMLFWISLGLALLFVFVYHLVDWARFFNVSSAVARKEAGPAVAVYVGCFLINLPLSVIPRIQSGYQEGYVSSIWLGTSNLLELAGIIVVVHLKAGLPWLVLGIAAAPIIGNFLNGIFLFAFQRPWLFPKWQDVNVLVFERIGWTGFLFLLIQLANLITSNSDNIIITRTLGPASVTNYAIPSKLFSLIPIVLYFVLAPLWPAYGEASARGDFTWAKKTLIKAITVTFAVCSLSSILLITFGERILHLWIGSKVLFSLPLMTSLGIWTTLSLVISSMALFLNAINKIGFQAIFALSTAFLTTIAKVILAGTIGLPGVVLGNIAVSSLLMFIPYTIYLVRRFSRTPEGYALSRKAS